MKLITCGDSFTAGYRLKNPNQDSWPKVLADKLGWEVINYGREGMGNDYIFSCAIDHYLTYPEDKENSFLIIALTNYNRIDFCSPTRGVFSTLPNRKGDQKDAMFEKFFFEKYWVESFYFKKFLRSFLMLQSYLDAEKIKYMFVDSFPIAINNETLNEKIVKQMLDKIYQNKNYLFPNKENLSSMCFPDILQCGHPNEKGHMKIADFLYGQINVKKI